ncbi:MAG TPA: type II toxin-antitoxin system RelE/ParE family toxin [Rhodanobacteraceae bacterium]|nr:type II toxin-antitoxin system RelE/ParE family toxin [Rhodanobacteraceae bacterium]
MFEIVESATYKAWFAGLRDVGVRARIDARIRRLSLGNPGHHRVLKGGIAELKVDAGPGFRVYYAWRGRTLLILLCGGDKSTQQGDIRNARRIAEEFDA